MKKSLFLSVASFLCLSTTSIALAQAQMPSGPPKVLSLIQEDVKPGKDAAHEKVEAGWPSAFANAKSPAHYIAMVAVSGPSEAWFLTGFDSMAAWEKNRMDNEKNAALTAQLDQLGERDGDLLSGIRSIVAGYRDDLSVDSGNVNLGKMHYFSVTTVRVRPGHNLDFEAARKIVKAAHEKAEVKDSHVVYQVQSGLPNGTFLIFTPMRSLAEADAGPQIHGKAYQDAIGDEGRAKLRELASSGEISAEADLFLFNPKMSYVSKEMAAADPDFWTPKPATKVSAVAKKEVKQTAAK